MESHKFVDRFVEKELGMVVSFLLILLKLAELLSDWCGERRPDRSSLGTQFALLLIRCFFSCMKQRGFLCFHYRLCQPYDFSLGRR